MKTSNFGVNYVELDNSPRLRFSRKTNSAIRQFLVYDWDQVQDFARELIGSYTVEGVVAIPGTYAGRTAPLLRL